MGKKKHSFWVRNGDSLLITAAGLLGALGAADEFPQDKDGIEALFVAAGKGPEGQRMTATYEGPDAPITYLGGHGTWIAPAGDGRLRIRERDVATDELASLRWVLGPDGSLGDPERIEGYGVAEAELPAAARAELEEMERRRQEMLARQPESERLAEEHRDRFKVRHLLGTVAGPEGQDPRGPMVSHVVLYDTGLIVNYLVPRPRPEGLDPDDPRAEKKAAEPTLFAVDDDLGTEFSSGMAHLDGNGDGLLRGRCEVTPAVPAEASRLLIRLDDASVEIELGPA